MLINVLLSEGNFAYKILQLMLCIIAFLPAITLHEWGHGFASYKFGDSTAKQDGRLSLNPLDHMDPMGSLMLLLFGFGWAKPVPVNTRYLKKPKRDMAIISLAGPLMNFIAGFISAFLFVLTVYISKYNAIDNITVDVIKAVFQYSMLYNIGLGTFNLIPLPPLDGSNILMGILPQRLAVQYAKVRYYSRYILMGILLLNFLPYPLGAIGDVLFMPLNWIQDVLLEGFVRLSNTIIAPMFEDIFINFTF